ncbi:MAG: ATP-binding protein [Pseudomonadota bacterium]
MTFAEAMPEKRLFVSLITRDISLGDAILDLVDNSVNAAMHGVENPLNSAKAFHTFLTDPKTKPTAEIRIEITERAISVIDDAGGIDFETARTSIFHFGHPESDEPTRDRLSVFGIGMKRAIFKLGNAIDIHSDHADGGFSMKLDAAEWEALPQAKWGFDISKRPKATKNCGTVVKVSELHDDVKRRVADKTFIPLLREKVSKTYALFIGRLVQIFVNNERVDGVTSDIGQNVSHEAFKLGNVQYSITVGIASPSAGKTFTAESSGWFVFCNGRALTYADKSAQTGWGGEILPAFQPKHRPFLGFVFFYSADPEELPWTTTKDSINQESLVWQDARRNMGRIARPVISLLDNRYTDEGTELDSGDLNRLAGGKQSPLTVSVARASQFKPPRQSRAALTKVQFDIETKDLVKIRKHLGKPSASASSVGRMAFDYYVRNEVGSK